MAEGTMTGTMSAEDAIRAANSVGKFSLADAEQQVARMLEIQMQHDLEAGKFDVQQYGRIPVNSFAKLPKGLQDEYVRGIRTAPSNFIAEMWQDKVPSAFKNPGMLTPDDIENTILPEYLNILRTGTMPSPSAYMPTTNLRRVRSA